MYIKNDKIKMLYRMIFILMCEAGIVMQYVAVSRIGSVAMHSCYYTILSNFVCLFYFAYLVAFRPKENATVKGAVTICIALTGLVYHIMLASVMGMNGGGGKAEPALMVSNNFVHTIIPIMVFVDYLLFTKKGDFKALSPLKWTAIPLAYLVFALIRAEVSTGMFTTFGAPSRYPYPFMDFDVLGAKALAAILIIGIAYIAFGYILYLFDFLLGRLSKKIKS